MKIYQLSMALASYAYLHSINLVAARRKAKNITKKKKDAVE
jgi:hypothetical protein